MAWHGKAVQFMTLSTADGYNQDTWRVIACSRSLHRTVVWQSPEIWDVCLSLLVFPLFYIRGPWMSESTQLFKKNINIWRTIHQRLCHHHQTSTSRQQSVCPRQISILSFIWNKDVSFQYFVGCLDRVLWYNIKRCLFIYFHCELISLVDAILYQLFRATVLESPTFLFSTALTVWYWPVDLQRPLRDQDIFV